MTLKYDHNTHWVSKQIESGVFWFHHPVIVSVIKFTLPWNILAIAYTATQWSEISLSFLYASALGLLWINLAPYLIWIYDERVLPEFFEHLGEIIPDDQERDKLARKYNDFFAKHRLSVSAFWIIAFNTIVYVSQPVLQSQGMTGSGTIFIWTTHAYATYIGAVLSHGFVGPATTLLLIHEVTDYELEIDPLHPDNLGGLSTVGYVSIRTTLLYSSASFFLPLLFYFSSSGGQSNVILGITSLYILTILISFVYPTAIVNRRAQDYRDAKLEELRQRYLAIQRRINEPERDEISELNKRLELQRVQQEYEKFNSVNLYPLQITILTRLLGSVILPILFTVIEFYLPTIM